MKTGELDQLIYFESPVDDTSTGEAITTWSDVSGDSPRSPEFAKVISQKGSESFEAARTNSIETVRVLTRFRSDVVTTWRFEWENQIYNIIAVDRSLRRDGELWITAELLGAS